jgi:hypothetical protein
MGHKVRRDLRVILETKAFRVSRALRVTLVPQVHRVFKERLGQKATLGLLELLEQTAQLERRAFKAFRGRLDQQAQREIRETKAILGLRACRVYREKLDQRVILGLLELLALRV